MRTRLRHRLALAADVLAVAAVLVLLFAPAAFGADNGEGLAGETTDKMVTFFSLGVTLFFVVFVFVMSALQALLDKRKEAKKAASLARRSGW